MTSFIAVPFSITAARCCTISRISASELYKGNRSTKLPESSDSTVLMSGSHPLTPSSGFMSSSSAASTSGLRADTVDGDWGAGAGWTWSAGSVIGSSLGECRSAGVELFSHTPLTAACPSHAGDAVKWETDSPGEILSGDRDRDRRARTLIVTLLGVNCGCGCKSPAVFGLGGLEEVGVHGGSHRAMDWPPVGGDDGILGSAMVVADEAGSWVSPTTRAMTSVVATVAGSSERLRDRRAWLFSRGRLRVNVGLASSVESRRGLVGSEDAFRGSVRGEHVASTAMTSSSAMWEVWSPSDLPRSPYAMSARSPGKKNCCR